MDVNARANQMDSQAAQLTLDSRNNLGIKEERKQDRSSHEAEDELGESVPNFPRTRFAGARHVFHLLEGPDHCQNKGGKADEHVSATS